jgi:hypothetical protein
VRAVLVVSIALAACGGGDNATPTPDAAQPMLDAAPDAAQLFPACHELAGAAATLPVHLDGTLAGADLQSPTSCASIDAPYGIASAGPDAVVPLVGLVPGTAYVVQLHAPADLGFYVATGCSTASGPSADECALFVDASAGSEEVGRFVATASVEYVVVDYYQSATPSDLGFTLDVYAEACTDDSACTSGPPVCFRGRCVECGDDFDCTNAAQSRCDTTSNACAAGFDVCAGDDATEPDNDGPAGAVALVPDGGGAIAVTAQICSTPRAEADYYKLTVDAGETWDLSLTWTGGRDLDLEVFDATGREFGLSYWEQPETMRLTYLPAGTYYVRISDFSTATTSSIDYTLAGQRVDTTGCNTSADCAATYRNQIFRGTCDAGACRSIDGSDVAAGGACDTQDDCAAGLECPDFYFMADADTRSVCAPQCTTDGDCAAMGDDYVCSTYFATENFCVQKCTSDDQCPTDPSSQPVSGPWYRLVCQTSTGRCVFP